MTHFSEFQRHAYAEGSRISMFSPTQNGMTISSGKSGARSTIDAYDPQILAPANADMEDKRTRLAYAVQKNRAKMSVSTPFHTTPGYPHPGISSVLNKFDVFKYDLAYTASSLHKPEIKDGFADESCITGDFSPLLSATGVQGDPMSIPIVDRTKLFADKELATNFLSSRDEEIFSSIHRAIFGSRNPEADARFNIDSSTGMPLFFSGRSDVMAKQANFRQIIKDCDLILDLIMKDDVVTLYQHYGIMNGCRLVKRQQPDGVVDLLGGDLTPKARLMADYEYAISGGRRGSLIEADKTFITRDIFGLKYGVGMRVRTAYAVNGQINFLLTSIMAGIRSEYFSKYAFTWHHTTPEHLYSKLEGVETVVGADMTTMDQLLPAFVLVTHAKLFGDYYDDRLTKLLTWFNGMPCFTTSVGVGRSPLWLGDPRDPSTFNLDMGLSSGRADNPDLGKLWGTFVYMVCLFNTIPDILDGYRTIDECVQEILLGHHKMCFLLNMGDDVVFCFRKGYGHHGTNLRTAFSKKDKSVRQYADLDAEDGVAFLGNVFWIDDAGRIGMPKPNPITFLKNLHCPEHSVNTSSRPFWAHGRLEALSHYSRAGSIISDLIEMSDDLWKKHLPDFRTPYQSANDVKAVQQPPSFSGILSDADYEVLLNPAKLHYKFSAEDISPEIMGMFTSKIDGTFISKNLSFLRRR